MEYLYQDLKNGNTDDTPTRIGKSHKAAPPEELQGIKDC